MFDSIIDSIVTWLTNENINAVRRFPETKIERAESVVAVSIKSAVMTASGAGNYLGIYEQGGVLCEVYGTRADMTFALDIYTPSNSGTELFDAIADAIYSLPDGLKLKSFECEDALFDEESGMFCMKSRLNCTAIMVRTENTEHREFTGFVLRGELSGYEC